MVMSYHFLLSLVGAVTAGLDEALYKDGAYNVGQIVWPDFHLDPAVPRDFVICVQQPLRDVAVPACRVDGRFPRSVHPDAEALRAVRGFKDTRGDGVAVGRDGHFVRMRRDIHRVGVVRDAHTMGMRGNRDRVVVVADAEGMGVSESRLSRGVALHADIHAMRMPQRIFSNCMVMPICVCITMFMTPRASLTTIIIFICSTRYVMRMLSG